MILVDTGAWFAMAVPSDPDHHAARKFAEAAGEPFCTTDYVVDELLTLFRRRRQVQRAKEWINEVLLSDAIDFVRITPADFDRATVLYRDYDDKLWSFTDCTSLSVMERLGITKAFSFDEHFHQFGSIVILP